MLVDPLPRKQAPRVAIDAKFSIPFTVALALARGRVGLDDFDATSLADPGVLCLAAKVRPVPVAGQGWEPGSGAALEITLANGQRLAGELPDALGCPVRPLDEGALIDKFIACATRAAVPVGEREARDLAGRILRLEACEDVGALFAG